MKQCNGLQLAECLHRDGLLLVETFRKWWTTALPSMTGTWCIPSFYRWKIKLLYLFLRLLFQIFPRNHNWNVLNVFFIVLSHNNARSENGQRTVRERSEYSMTVLSTGSAREHEKEFIVDTLKEWGLEMLIDVFKGKSD